MSNVIKGMETIEPLVLKPLETEDDRHEVTNKTINTLRSVMLTQDNYGMEKYKEPLKHYYNYDWLQMFLEEMADGLKYIQNEIDRKEAVIHLLECGLKMDNPKYAIESALNILKIQGTGK